MKFVLIGLLTFGICIGGCHNHPHPSEDAATQHLLQYFKLKEKNPDSALIELKAHANIAFNAHPKANEWAELVARLDRAKEASLPDILRLSRLDLEIARNNKAENGNIHELEDDLLLWEEVEKELKTESIDPNTFFSAFELEYKKSL